MDLKCPSCGTSHQSDDYPGAFEIQCSCGYSILVPDEDDLNAPAPDMDEPDYSASPMAMSEYDDAHKIQIDEHTSPLHSVEVDDSTSALNMTPPEELPEGMPYDPFELQDPTSASGSESDDPASEFIPEGFPHEEVQDFGDSAKFEANLDFTSNSPEETDNEDTTSEDNSEESPVAEKPVEPAPEVRAQDVAHKVQLASLGYLIGNKFNIELSEVVDGELMANMLDRMEDQLALHPWLKEHFKHNRKDFEKIVATKTLPNIPELIALEIYLFCLEQNLSCRIQTST